MSLSDPAFCSEARGHAVGNEQRWTAPTDPVLMREALFALYGFPGMVFVDAGATSRTRRRPSRFALRLTHEYLSAAKLGVLMSLARTASVAAKLRIYASSATSKTRRDGHSVAAFKSTLMSRLAAFASLIACIERAACISAYGACAIGTGCAREQGADGGKYLCGENPVVTLSWIAWMVGPATRELESLWRCCRAAGAGLMMSLDTRSSGVCAAILSVIFKCLECCLAISPAPPTRVTRTANSCQWNYGQPYVPGSLPSIPILSHCGASPNELWRDIFIACCRPYFRIMGQWCVVCTQCSLE